MTHEIRPNGNDYVLKLRTKGEDDRDRLRRVYNELKHVLPPEKLKYLSESREREEAELHLFG